MKILMPYFKRYRLDVWIAMLSVIVLVFATLWQPRLLQVIMEAIIKNDQATVFREGLMLLGLAVLGIIGGIVNTIYAARVALGVATDLRADLYAKVQSLAYADVEKFSPSNLVVRMTNDINQVQQIVMAGFQQITRIPLLFIGGVNPSRDDDARTVVGHCRHDGGYFGGGFVSCALDDDLLCSDPTGY